MCARRFLMLIFILTLIFVGGAFALYQWGSNALVRMATPVGHFQAPASNTEPDYSKEANWLARPGRPDDGLWLPSLVDGRPPQPLQAAHPTALFYIHPTTYLERDHWNAPITSVGESFGRARMFVRSQATAFNSVADVWAPQYRQASYGAFLLRSEDANKALNLAYRDVLAAFDAFLTQQPKDKPIILAGHSQGSLHLLRLLGDRKDALKRRLVAAYVVGWPVGVRADLPSTGLQPCVSSDQTGCVLSWQSFKEPDNTDLITDAWVGTTGLTGAKRVSDDILCNNPLTGGVGGAASATANKGTLVPDRFYQDAGAESGRVGARCDKGFLLIDGDVPNLGPYVLPGNNYHAFDYALFWGSIRADAERRVAAWQKH